MGCSTSKLDDEEAVQLCKDRKRFIKQAVEQRARFASGHLAYIQSLKKVSAALREYIEGDREPHDFLLDSFITPPFTPPIKKTSPGFISISPKSFSRPAQIQSQTPSSTLKVNYLRSGGNPAVSVEERPQSPETVRLEAYSPPMQYQYGFDGYFPMHSSPMYPSSFFSNSPNRPSANIPPPSPQTSQWDFFWNPFSSLDNYGYPNRASLEETVMDDDIRGLRQLREEEGIPDLEDDIEIDESDIKMSNVTHERAKVDVDCCNREEVIVEDVDEDDEEDEDGEEEEKEGVEEVTENETRGFHQSHESTTIEVSRSQTARQVEATNTKEMAVGDKEARDETPGFTVYVNRRPTSMAEVIKELDDQFMVVCSAASEVSAMLEASKAQYSAHSTELTGFFYHFLVCFYLVV